jgi:hypothetical protein
VETSRFSRPRKKTLENPVTPVFFPYGDIFSNQGKGRGVDAEIHVFLNLALVEGQLHAPAALLPRKGPPSVIE